jgi:hypothetical protein
MKRDKHMNGCAGTSEKSSFRGPQKQDVFAAASRDGFTASPEGIFFDRGRAFLVSVLFFLFLLVAQPAEAVQRTGFDHLTTGYELKGAHRDMSCEYCHVDGVFRGTPRTCAGCHTIGGRVSATSKPPTHIATNNACDLCHALYNFAPIYRMDHTAAKGTCFSCHNGVTAQGKNATHIASDTNCTACHTTVAFAPARLDHTDLLQKDQCTTCHNGVAASAKSIHHIPTTTQCNDCHTTLSWSPARFNHSGLSNNCQSCHNGTTALGKVSNHIATSLDCSNCHRYPTWTPYATATPAASSTSQPAAHHKVTDGASH